jgi:hypothetical protein
MLTEPTYTSIMPETEIPMVVVEVSAAVVEEASVVAEVDEAEVAVVSAAVEEVAVVVVLQQRKIREQFKNSRVKE